MSAIDSIGFLIPSANYRLRYSLHQHLGKNKYMNLNRPRPDHGLYFVMDGEIAFKSKTKDFKAGCGTIVLLPKGSLYEATIDNMMHNYLINFDMQPEPAGNIPKEPLILLSDCGQEYIDLFNSVYELMNKYEKDQKFLKKAALYRLLAKIIADMNEKKSGKSDLAIQNAKSLLETLPRVSISEIAKKCGISVSGLRASFQQTYGISPVKYRTEFKINKAKYLLNTSELSIAEISEMLDFSDETYFCRIFGKYVGCSPKEYAKRKKI